MNNGNKIKLWILASCLILFVISVFVIFLNDRREQNVFPRLTTEDSVKSKVLSVQIDRGNAKIIFESGLKRAIYQARNNNYQPSDLSQF